MNYRNIVLGFSTSNLGDEEMEIGADGLLGGRLRKSVPNNAPRGLSYQRQYLFRSLSDSVAEKFAALFDEWEVDTAVYSSISMKKNHHAYRDIVRLGMGAVPLMLKKLEENPTHLFPALKEIVGEDPVPIEDRGNVEAMSRAWINWGKRAGII